MLFFFNDTATTKIYTLPLHDALPILARGAAAHAARAGGGRPGARGRSRRPGDPPEGRTRPARFREEGAGPGRHAGRGRPRSEEHTSELQSRQYLVCRLLLEKKY